MPSLDRSSGYLTSVTNPNRSGLARIVFRDELTPSEATSYTTCYCESGFGVRQLVAALGDGSRLTTESAHIPVEYTVDALGLLVCIAVEVDA